MRKIYFLLTAMFFVLFGHAQLTGTKNVPGDYPTLTAAITDLNTVGVGAGGVTFNVTAAQTTAASLLITATGTAANPIIFQGNANTVTATGTAGTTDGIFVLAGSDYVTINNFVLSGDATVEWGVALLKANGTAPYNGSENNSITNNTITLSKTNTASVGVYGAHIVSTSTLTLPTTGAVASDANNNNLINNNNISNVYFGVQLNGMGLAAAYDDGNTVSANTIGNYGGSTTTPYGIRTINTMTVTVSGNNITLPSGTTTTAYGIQTSTGTTLTTVTNNTVTVSSSGTTAQLNGISNTGSPTTITMTGNTVTGSTYSTATTAAFVGIQNSGFPGTLTLSNNNVTNNTLSGTGVMTLLDGGSSTTASIIGNTVDGNSKTGAGGTMYCSRAGSSVITYSNNTITNNSTPTNSGAGSSTIYGYYNFGVPSSETYTNNTISGLSISGTTTSTFSTIYGMFTNTSGVSVKSISGNVISSLSNNTGGTIYGLYTATGNTVDVFRNKIGDLQSASISGAVYGLYIASGTTVTAYNNLIGDLRTPASTNLNGDVGVYVNGGVDVRVYYNTVYLNASSSGANFGTSALYASTTPTVTLIDNILVNLSSPAGTGFTSSYRRSTTTLTSYNNTSNNNIFYAGTPGANNVIFYDGTTGYQTLAAYQTLVAPRDASSYTENVSFLNTNVAAPDFLHINPITPTYAESGGAPISGITTDYDLDVRNTGNPDIGADEFAGVSLISCFNPGTPSASGVTATTANINWALGTGSANFQWELRTGGSCGSGSPVQSGTNTTGSLSLTGLTTTTQYTLCVRRDCGGGTFSLWQSVTFTTPCANATLPFFEGFNTSGTAVFPTCWTQQFVTGTDNISFQTASFNPNTTPFEGTRHVYYNAFNFTSGDETRLVSPPIATTGTPSVDVEFYFFNENSAFYNTGAFLNEGVQVQYSTDGVTWTNAGPLFTRQDASLPSGGAGQWNVKTLTLPAAAGNQPVIYVGFKFHSSFGDNMSMDAVTISATPVCPKVTGVTVGSITNNSASVGFSCTSCSGSYILEYGPTGFTPGTGATAGVGGTVVAGASSPIAITGLSPNTTYQVYVRQNCTGAGNGYSLNTFPQSFTTLCGITTLPLFEGFNTSGTAVFPQCWTQQYVVGTGNLSFQTNSGNPTTAPYEGSRFAFFNSFSIGSGNETRLVSPGFASTAIPSVDVQFYWFNDNSNYTGAAFAAEGVQVQYSLDGVTWVDAGALIPRSNLALPQGWVKKTVTLPAAAGNQPVVYVGFKFHSQFGDNMSMDAVSIKKSPLIDAGPTAVVLGTTCPTPNLAVQVRIKNFGYAPLNLTANPVTITANISGAATGTLTGSATTGTIAVGDSLMVTLTPTFTFPVGGNYTIAVNATANPTPDDDTTNNSYTTVITLQNGPTPLSITPGDTSICSGSIVKLTGVGGSNVVSASVGGGSTANTTSTPFRGFYGGHKTQAIYTPAELSAIGLSAGTSISTIGYRILAFTSPYTFNGFTIAMKNVPSQTTLTAFVTGLTTVYPSTSFTLAGTAPFTTTFNLATPFTWDGTSSLLVETCWNNNDFGGSSGNMASVASTTTSGNTAAYFTNDATPDVCSNPGAPQLTALRPNVILGFTASPRITWSPAAGLYTNPAATIPYNGTDTATVIYAKPTATTTYSATATATSGCTVTATRTITFNLVTTISGFTPSQSVCLGSSAQFNVNATGANITFQWKKNGVSIPGATDSMLVFNPAAYSDSGNYYVVVTGVCGVDSTSSVHLTVNTITGITTQPVSQTTCVGTPITLSVSAVGSNLTYQWQKNGVNVTGALSPTFNIPSLSAADTGSYIVIISGSCGTDTSSVAVVGINQNNTWTGMLSPDWNTPGNWCSGVVPTSTTNIVIPSGTPFSPVVAGNASIGNLTISSGATVTTNSSGVLNIYGDLNIAGTLNASQGTIAFRGSSNQNVSGMTVANLTMNGAGGITLLGNLNVTSILNLTQGNITLGGNNVVLLTGATGSAQSHIVTNSTGKVTLVSVGANSVTAPVGPDATSYNPVIISNGSGRGFSIGVATGINPAIYDPTRAVNRTWNIVPSIVSSTPANYTLGYADADMNSNGSPTANMEVGVHNGTNWVLVTPGGGAVPTGGSTLRFVSYSSTTNGGPTVVGNIGSILLATAIQTIDPDVAGAVLMPNRVQNNTVLRITMKRASMVNWSMIDMNGKVAKRFTSTLSAGTTDIPLQLSNLAGGNYLLVGENAKGKVATLKLIKL